MSKTLEFHGKNIDNALEKASQELNIPVEKIKHEVVTYGSSGIFGLVGVKKAKIKVFVEKKNKKSDPEAEKKTPCVQQTQKEPLEPELQPNEENSTIVIIDDEVVRHGNLCLQTIIDGISQGATIDTQQTSNKIIYSISGGDSGVMIGKRGQTLEAIQYLLEKMINKKNEQRVRVIVDIEGYLEKRKINLRQMATRMAEKARRIKKPVTIGQMNAHDRRIVHIHLKNESGIRTQSIGEGYYRKLMIFPKKNHNGRKK